MLIPARRKKILEVFMADPFKEVHLREIARLSNVSLNNVDIFLRSLGKKMLFKKSKISNMTFYMPNLENEYLLKLFEYLELERRMKFLEKNKKIARLLQKYQQNLLVLSYRKVQMVILFGSVARGDWIRNSDIDMLVVVADKEGDTTAILNKAKIEVAPLLEIRPICTTIDKFVEGLKNKTEFYEGLWKDRIVLYNEFLFWQLIKEKSKAYV